MNSEQKVYSKLQNKIRRERKKVIDAGWTDEMQAILYELQPTCVVCGSDDRLAIDHIKSLIEGHGLSPSNAVRLCAGCNAKKWRHPLENMPVEFQEKVMAASKKFQDTWDKMQKVMYS